MKNRIPNITFERLVVFALLVAWTLLAGVAAASAATGMQRSFGVSLESAPARDGLPAEAASWAVASQTQPGSTSPTPNNSAQQQTPPAKDAVTVWVNTETGVYHKPGSRWYGKTKKGKYMLEADAIKAGYKPAKPEK
jgi:hypothetical protein